MSECTPTTACAPMQFLAFPGLDPSIELVVCTPFADILEYQGTRAALEAEGIIPAGTDWPEGFREQYWEDGCFRYCLRRERPDGARGPRRQFVGVDWWMLRCDPLNGKSIVTRTVECKAKELDDYIRLTSAAGEAEQSRQYHRYRESLIDKTFQTFKAACGIVERKRGGPRKRKEACPGDGYV